jgi:hypothetical protein
VPLLIAIVNLTALAHGFVPLHASAFTFEGRGILVTGWSKGGKTEALLAFMQRGAEYLGDEWIYLDPERGRMFGIPQPIRLWDWHLRQLPTYRQGLGGGARARLAAIAFLLSTLDHAGRTAPRGSAAHRTCERFREIVHRQAHVDAAPEALFGTLGPLAAPLDRVVLVASDEAAGITVEPMDPVRLARRMEFSVRYEFAPLLTHYDMFRFAFPDSENPWIESIPERLGPLLARALAGKPTFAVRHPYPFELAALFEAMRPCVAGA